MYILGTPQPHGNGGWAGFTTLKESDTIEDLQVNVQTFLQPEAEFVEEENAVYIPYSDWWRENKGLWICKKVNSGGLRGIKKYCTDDWYWKDLR